MKKDPVAAKFLATREEEDKKRALRSLKKKQLSSLMESNLAKKCEDPGMFSIPISITNTLFDGAMLDLGASINVIPSSLYESLKLRPLKYTRVAISLANKSNVLPLGKIEDVIVKVGAFSFPTDFYVLEMDTDDELIPIILGRPFMKSARMIIDVHMGSVSVQSGRDKLTYQVFKHTIPSKPTPSLNGITITINNDNKEPITVLGNGPMLLTMQEASSSNGFVLCFGQ